MRGWHPSACPAARPSGLSEGISISVRSKIIAAISPLVDNANLDACEMECVCAHDTCRTRSDDEYIGEALFDWGNRIDVVLHCVR